MPMKKGMRADHHAQTTCKMRKGIQALRRADADLHHCRGCDRGIDPLYHG